MKKVCNVRFPVFAACALCLGIAAGLCMYVNKIDLFWLAAVVPPTAAVYIFCALSRKTFAPFFITLFCALFFVAGVVGCHIYARQFSTHEITTGQSYALSGIVWDKSSTDYGEVLLLASVTADGQPLRGKTRVYLGGTYGEACEVGDRISFTAALSAYEFISDGVPGYAATQNIRYFCSAFGELTVSSAFSPFAAVRKAMTSAAYDNLSAESAAVVCAMLLGDTDGVDSGLLQTFRWGGIAHIFAVSGLHIGILYGVISFIMRKLRVNQWLVCAASLCAVFFYAGVCAFTLSSVRAVIMCTVAALARLVHQKYDSLNALAVAVVILLFIHPVSLYTAGFQLSVCAVLGICLLSKKIACGCKKLRLPRKAGEAAGVTLGAQMGTTPVMLANFGYVSGAGLLLNLLLIPLLSLFFVLIFIAVALTAAIPYLGALVSLSALPLEALLSFLTAFGFEKSLITLPASGAFVPTYAVILALLSDKLRLSKKVRAAALLLSAGALILCVVCNLL